MTVRQFCVVAFAVVGADQVSKHFALRALSPQNSISIIPGFAQLTLTTNTGAAFGALQGASPYLAVVALIAVVGIAFHVGRQSTLDRTTGCALALALGGALGNFIDRAFRRYVVDFLDVYVGPHHWPVFNVADACICTGVGLLALQALRGGGDTTPISGEPRGEQPASVSE
ncbi:MAG: signal peptidase II [Capsulimonadaceae bacterium]|nr:signal peptidase II [Capsulimonadaceae bacterium]